MNLKINVCNNYSINVKNLIKIFDEQSIIRNISFTVEKNSIVGVLGKNGAGKQLYLECLWDL